MNHLFFILSLLFLSGCNKEENVSSSWQAINGRDESLSIVRHPLYQARIPAHWQRKDPSPTESIADTTKPLCEFWIAEEGEKIRITVHNFPASSTAPKIPPMAQLQRWKNQFDRLEPTQVSITSCAHGGFSGLCLEATGILNGTAQSLLGWSMQLAPEHTRQLNPEDRQTRADYTIKAVGPAELMNKFHTEIMNFAYSFELIEELPSRL